jgi:2-aminoethylphosphonate-pyruvate transaminase
MLQDAGSWDAEFNSLVASLRRRLVRLAGLSPDAGWEAVLLQGSGTYGVEAVFQTCVPPAGKVAVLTNGAYGNRMAQILQRAGIDHVVLRCPEDRAVPPEALAELLRRDPAVSHVAVVHCETTTGLLNPIEALGHIAKSQQKVFIVDAMSSFGGMPIDFDAAGIDYLVSSANKCLEGVPGFCFVLGRRQAFADCKGRARSLSLDLAAQLDGFNGNGQFRFTPPTHAVLALNRALDELEQEGGISGRAARYRRNHQVLLRGMQALGLPPYLKPEIQSYIITAFVYPRFPAFSFQTLYRELSQLGFLIYPGKISEAETFRIGTIGQLFPGDLQALVDAIGETLEKMQADGRAKAGASAAPASAGK